MPYFPISNPQNNMLAIQRKEETNSFTKTSNLQYHYEWRLFIILFLDHFYSYGF